MSKYKAQIDALFAKQTSTKAAKEKETNSYEPVSLSKDLMSILSELFPHLNSEKDASEIRGNFNLFEMGADSLLASRFIFLLRKKGTISVLKLSELSRLGFRCEVSIFLSSLSYRLSIQLTL